MRYPVKYPFRDRDGIERVPGDIMEIDDASRAASLQSRRLIGRALQETKKPEPVPEVQEPEKPRTGPGFKAKGKKAADKAVKGGETR